MNGFGTGRPGFPANWMVFALGGLVTVAAGGCKMGTAGTKPSWWAFGGSPTSAAEKLSAAPSFAGGVEKPSATAKPYPTTSTPNSYVLDDAAKSDGVAVASAAAPPAAVTYGVTPPAAPPDPVALATGPAARPETGGSPAAVTTQVGPYAALPSEQPAATAAELPPLQAIAGGATPPAASSFGAAPQQPPTAASATSPAPQRVADARGSSAWPETQAGAGRYDTGSASRFGGGAAIDQPLPPPAAAVPPPAAAVPPPASASMLPAALDPLPPAASPAAAPPGGFPAPAASGAPAPATPAPPVRRPDRVYRPGGTSSYKPSRAILTAEPAAADPGGVRTVGFETQVGDAP